jgi:hypothetical protein
MSLRSLQDEGAIRIERHRIIINKELLQKVAEVAGLIQSKGGCNGSINEIREG